mmetsp:Transcript_44379/g.136983  ORF Transcript_44379/g.136983 Transcript_44379/m.136983 type:complete len:275 (-) Transcript_44379:93-917(-)
MPTLLCLAAMVSPLSHARRRRRRRFIHKLMVGSQAQRISSELVVRHGCIESSRSVDDNLLNALCLGPRLLEGDQELSVILREPEIGLVEPQQHGRGTQRLVRRAVQHALLPAAEHGNIPLVNVPARRRVFQDLRVRLPGLIRLEVACSLGEDFGALAGVRDEKAVRNEVDVIPLAPALGAEPEPDGLVLVQVAESFAHRGHVAEPRLVQRLHLHLGSDAVLGKQLLNVGQRVVLVNDADDLDAVLAEFLEKSRRSRRGCCVRPRPCRDRRRRKS